MPDDAPVTPAAATPAAPAESPANPLLPSGQRPAFEAQYRLLAQIQNELDGVFRERVESGQIWGVALVIAVDHAVQEEIVYFPDPDQPGLTPEQAQQVAGIKRMGVAAIGGRLNGLLKKIWEFFGTELGIPGFAPK
jgi:hypothetical protein